MNSDSWYWVDSGVCAYDYNMALDEALMDLAPRLEKPVLRFYGWTEPAASFGYSQHYADIERITPLRPLVRRPTGGGLVPHDADWTYSVAVPPGHAWYQLKAAESYERVHQWICDAFARLGVKTVLAPEPIKVGIGQCFVGAEKSDLLWKGRKIAGAAQRRTHDGLLIQGSVQPPLVGLARSEWQASMQHVAQEKWSVCWALLSVTGELAEKAEQLRVEKYSKAEFNRRR